MKPNAEPSQIPPSARPERVYAVTPKGYAALGRTPPAEAGAPSRRYALRFRHDDRLHELLEEPANARLLRLWEAFHAAYGGPHEGVEEPEPLCVEVGEALFALIAVEAAAHSLVSNELHTVPALEDCRLCKSDPCLPDCGRQRLFEALAERTRVDIAQRAIPRAGRS